MSESEIKRKLSFHLMYYERSLCRFEKHFPESQKIPDFRVYLYHYNFETPGQCLTNEFDIVDFIKENKVDVESFPEEFKKFNTLRHFREQFFEKHKKEIIKLLKAETKVMINGYSTYLDSLDQIEPEEMQDMLDIRTGLFHLLKYFSESGINVDSFKKDVKKLDEYLKSKMEDIAHPYNDSPYDHSRPIDYSRWWLFMDRIVAKKKKREMALIPTDDENEEEEP